MYNRNDIGLHLVSHFSSIFSFSNPVLTGLDDLFTPVITSSENDLLCLIPDEYEIWMAVSDLGSDKSLGSDGMTGLFYKTYWKIVKHNVIRFIKSFFRHGHLLKSFNHTHLALIPKVSNPNKVSQFRPISLGNFIFKVISKILANRLKPLLHKIISPNQSAFLQGRSIHDNSILAHEIFHSMKKKKGNGGLMAIKLDMEKAFDRMEWSFLLRIFSLLGFSPKWLQLVEQCISTASFSILLDGSPFGMFISSRGLRQGDPLSPFLFILGSEALSRLIVRAENHGFINGIKISRDSPRISYLLFVDDLMFFAKASTSEASIILDCLTTYLQWSGQNINFQKSSIFFSLNSHHNAIANIKSILNLQQISPRAKYLGLPLFVNKTKKRAFEDIKANILSRITGWKAKLLSQAARTTLIKFVANATPVYTMSLFLLPKAIWLDIDSSLRKFWWGYPQEKKHCLSLMGWNKICAPRCFGGLGLRQMEFLNFDVAVRPWVF